VTHSGSAWVRLGSLGGLVPRTANLLVAWYDSGLTLIRTDTSPSLSESIQGIWAQVAVTGVVSPDNAAFAQLTVQVLAVDEAEYHFIDGFQLEPSALPGAFNSNYADSTLPGSNLVPATITSRETAVGSAKVLAGAAASRPAASIAGRLYFATDTGVVSYDSGSAWTNGVGASVTYTSPNAEPAEQSLAGWNFDPAFLSTVSNNPPVAGTMYLLRIKLKNAATISNALVSVAASGVALTNCFVALYDSTGTRVAVTADVSSSLTSTGLKTLAFTGSYSAAAGTFYVGLLVGSATTAPAWAISTASNIAAVNAGIAASPYRFGSYTVTGQSSCPASFNTSTQMASATKPFWSALS